MPKGKLDFSTKAFTRLTHILLSIPVQERLTKQIADAVMKAIEPRGVAVVCEAA